MKLALCPHCQSKLTYPDKPVRDVRGRRRVMVDLPCPNCPAAITVYEDTGDICCWTPNQPLTMKHVNK